MQRIIKRFLLHSQGMSDNVYERNFEELKQDLQMIRYEILHDTKQTKNDNLNNISLIFSGLTILGDELFRNSRNTENMERFLNYKKLGDEIKELMEEENDTNSTLSLSINGGGAKNSNGNENETIVTEKSTPVRSLRNFKSIASGRSFGKNSFNDIVALAMKNREITSTSTVSSTVDDSDTPTSMSSSSSSTSSQLKGTSLGELDVINEIEESAKNIPPL
jgi:hypothetical protein